MSVAAARNWLSIHDEFIPAFDDFHNQVVKMLNREVVTLAETASIIMFDPGMSTLLLHQVNSKLKKNHRPGIDTVHTATGHLGKPTIAKLITQYKKLSEVCSNKTAINGYRQLLSENCHALVQLDAFARMQGIGNVDDMRSAMLLYNIGEMHACLFDPDKYQQYRSQSKTDKGDKNAATEKTFGFNFIQLGKLLAQKWALPELVNESFESSKNTGRKSRLIQLAADIACQAELGWYHKAMYDAQKKCAEYLNISQQEACQSIHKAAIMAARSAPMTDVFPAAARLILLPDVKPANILKPVAKTPVAKKISRPASLEKQLMSLLKMPEVSQSNILSLLLSGLQKDLSFSRVVLMLLSTDKSKLVTRTGKGLDNESAFNNLQLEIAQSGLIKSLIQKPQALCIDASNYKKYETLLPGKLKASCLCDNFVLMSIFIGNKPIGLVYCDRQHIEKPIDSASYKEFKSSVMMASKALTYVMKNKTRATA